MSVSTAKLLISFQLFSRSLTFLLNNLLARILDTRYLGLIAIRFEILMMTVLFLSREGIRLALLRFQPKEKDDEKSCRQFYLMSWFSFPLGLILSVVVGGLYLVLVPQEIAALNKKAYLIGVIGYLVAIVLELLTEPALLHCLQQGNYAIRLKSESAALITKVTSVLLLINFLRNGALKQQDDFALTIYAFSISQILYSLVLNVSYRVQCRKLFLPPSISETETMVFDKDALNLASQLTFQNVYKFALSQGDKLVLSSFGKLADQGVYAVVSNYGSLVLRVFFQPIEESSLQYFAKQFSSETASKQVKKQVVNYLAVLLKFTIYAGFVFIAFGSNFTFPLVRIVLGAKWTRSGAPEALAAYCWFLAAVIVSGIIESFVQIIITPEWLRWSRTFILPVSLFYWVLAVYLMNRLGSIGLVYAHTLNTAIQASISWQVIADFLQKESLTEDFRKQINLSHIPLAAFFSSFLICKTLNVLVPNASIQFMAAKIAVGLGLFSGCLVSLYKHENEFVLKFTELWRSKQKPVVQQKQD